MPTPRQIQLIHIAIGKVALTREQYLLLLHNIAGVESCKQLSQSDFEDVMAVLEDMGFHDSAGGENYWRRKVSLRGTQCGERMVFKILKLAEEAGNIYPVEAIIRRLSNGRTDVASQLYPKEAFNVIEALKAIVLRNETVAAPKDSPDQPAINRATFNRHITEPDLVAADDDVPF